MKKIILALICLLISVNNIAQAQPLKGRTIRDFNYSGNVFDISKNWATDEGYRIRSKEEGSILYKKGYGILTAPIFCKISQDHNNVHMESWIAPDIITRALGLFLILPKEIQLHSEGFRASIPREIGRTSINNLLLELKQKRIK